MFSLCVASIENAKAHSSHESLSQELFNKFASKDSLLFNAAFSTCNIKETETILNNGYVLYQDQGYGGRTTSQPYTNFIESIKKNLCENKSTKMKRELVKNPVHFFLPGGNHAIQTGTQLFYIITNGQEDKLVEESKFSRDREKKDGDWKIEKELGYPVNTKFNNNTSGSLCKEIQHMDGVLFDAYNAHNTEKMKSLFNEDLEFYHDKGGLIMYQKVMDGFRQVFENNKDIRRDLVPGSIEAYPIKDYGAVEIGAHRFCHTENGKDDCGAFRFVHVWQKKNGEWKISRIISYDH